MKSFRIRDFVFLHIIFLWYSCVGMFSKQAAQFSFLSIDYIKWYAGVLLIVGIYAILWQQALKRFPLTVAYANRSIVTVWSVVWGILFWNEQLSPGKIIGTFIILAGIILVVTGEKNES